MKRDVVSYTVLLKKYISESWFLKFTKQIKLKVFFYCDIAFLNALKPVPLKNDFESHAEDSQSKNRNKVKKEIGRSIFNDFNRLNPAKWNLESDPSYYLWKKVLKKIANGSLTDVFILMDVHTQRPKIPLQRELCNHVLEGKNLIKRFPLQQKEKDRIVLSTFWTTGARSIFK